jgi:two-component system, OmpR family, KDP operon response regulator KdpE
MRLPHDTRKPKLQKNMITATTSILLVEDDPLLRHAFRLLLEDAGYLVHEAGTAAQALDQAVSAKPALVLLDLGLPDRPGLEVARQLTTQPETAGIRVVALTGRVGNHERDACFDAGCSHFFTKPIEPRELLRRLPELLDNR